MQIVSGELAAEWAQKVFPPIATPLLQISQTRRGVPQGAAVEPDKEHIDCRRIRLSGGDGELPIEILG
jgi:hypothetical protein